PLLCLDHGLRDPSSSKPYVIRPIENYIDDPATIELVRAFGYGELPPGAAQAAFWHLNSGVSWQELASKLTGTPRNIVRNAYFSGNEIRAAMQIVQHARQMTVGQTVKPRKLNLDGDNDEEISPGEKAESRSEETVSDENVAADASEADTAATAASTLSETDAS
ncbi:MAG: hypothetical protein AAF961_15395, partial [Planctomycetota bacterium]